MPRKICVRTNDETFEFSGYFRILKGKEKSNQLIT